MEYAFVNSIFASIQGEGIYTGMPAIFLRMQGCQVNCPFCDTKESWQPETQRKMTLEQVVSEIRNEAKTGKFPLLVITGGEPLEQLPFVEQVVHELKSSFPKIQIETSGYVPAPESKIHKLAEICLSPKCKMAPVLQWYGVAESIKFLVGHKGLESPVDLEWVLETFPQLNSDTVFLQPIGYAHIGKIGWTYDAQKQTIRLAQKYGVRVSLQTHKILGIR